MFSYSIYTYIHSVLIILTFFFYLSDKPDDTIWRQCPKFKNVKYPSVKKVIIVGLSLYIENKW